MSRKERCRAGNCRLHHDLENEVATIEERAERHRAIQDSHIYYGAFIKGGPEVHIECGRREFLVALQPYAIGIRNDYGLDIVLGEPVGYAIVKSSINGRADKLPTPPTEPVE